MSKKLNDFHLKAAILCIDNAEQFLNDANLLRENESYGHAYSLAVLGFEEIGKTAILVDSFLGTLQEKTKEIQKKISKHLEKQFYLWNQIAALIIFEWYEIIQKSEFKDKIPDFHIKTKKDRKKFEKKFLVAVKEISKNTENKEAANISLKVLEIEDIKQLLEKNPSLMDDRKQAGFYVDINLDSKEVRNNPQTFTLENTELINTLESITSFARAYVEGINTLIKQPDWIERVLNIRKFMKLLND